MGESEIEINGLKAVPRASTPIQQADVADISARSDNVDISRNSLLLGVDHGAVHSLALPPYDIEVFDVDFQSWPTFRDLFTAVYVKNSRLSDIERLCHLLKKTSGDAREIVRRFPLTDRSFELAWRTLKETYDNLRILISNQLKLLFDLPVLDTDACISAMAVNNVSTNDWDPILIFLCVQRLPKISVTLWEQGISDESALFSWVDMDRFLMERIQTLTCLRDLKGIDASKNTDGRKLRTHFTNTAPKSSPSKSRNSQYTSHSSRDSVDKTCVLCPRQSHHLRVCPKFMNLSVNDRLTAVKRHRCCFNCLSRRHDVNNCATTRSCEKCQGRHHTLLHRDSSHSTNVTTTSSTVSAARPTDSSGLIDPQPSTSSGIVSGTSARQVFHVSHNRSVLLGTAMVNIVHQGMTYPARALIDPASEASFITENMQKLLGISTASAMSSISGVNQSVSITSRGICPLSIGSPKDESFVVEATALVLPKISGNLPSFQVSRNYMSRLPNLRLADPNLFDSRPVDLLLGADVYPKIILQGIRFGILGSLIAQQTVLGWLITGSIPTSNVTVFSTTVEFMEEDGLDKTLLRFWELEDLPRRAICSPADKFCEENYKNTTYRDSDRRYVVTLPIKPELKEQVLRGHSRTSCLKQFVRGEASLLRKPETKLMYDGVIKEYLDLQHMRPVSSTSPSDQTVCYLPHHPVINPEKLTSKLRVVFNASHKTSNGKSLNDILYVGPTLQLELVYLILRVNSAHTSLQRIVFRDSPQKDVQDYELQTVTFGVNCAPYLAIRTLRQLADDSENDYPHAAHILRRCMYLDDVLTGYHDMETAVEYRDQLIRVLSSARFELRKWNSNELAILESLPADHLVDAKLLAFVEASSSKPLDIGWNAQTHYSHTSRNVYHDTTLTATELKTARLRLAVLSQRAHYPDEYYCLMEKKPLGSRSSLLSLNPFLDEEWVMRLNGRLSKCPTLSYSERHPIIVPYNSRFARLLVKYVHDMSIHGGNQLVLRLIRIEYWIPRLTSLIRSTINRCKRCLLDRKKSCTQIMAALSPERTVLTRPFTTTVVDFAGPFDIKSFIGRACHTLGSHIRLVYDNASGCLSQIYISAWLSQTIFSDNGTNFVGASREMEKELRCVLKEGRDKLCSAHQFQQLSWQFIPAGTPHIGGLWEAAVKSFKTHFRKHASGFKFRIQV
ncbi:uncharacterized protein LOC142224895 [Haematobia irritans]|uniref:uncharacterized protein LOC142224895 n=1 Tax=Haematobia irritans TaxID=7368 RepID=UPI003F4FACDD